MKDSSAGNRLGLLLSWAGLSKLNELDPSPFSWVAMLGLFLNTRLRLDRLINLGRGALRIVSLYNEPPPFLEPPRSILPFGAMHMIELSEGELGFNIKELGVNRYTRCSKIA